MGSTRNFVILAHIDHGKSTLADRMLEITGTVDKRKMKAQYLDQLESERERGITIKMAPVRMSHNGFQLNLIDTPGHSDFKYEVSRALAAVEGAVLLVDASQGIQAQTLANFELAKKAGLTIIGAVTKIDLNVQDLNEVVNSLAELIGVDSQEILKVSGKTGEGVPELLDKVISAIPAPSCHSRGSGNLTAPAGISRALIFDSFYDDHKGIIASVRVFNGEFKKDGQIESVAVRYKGKIKEIGSFHPELRPADKLSEGEIGYIAIGIKDPDKIKIGDTITNFKFQISNFESIALAGYTDPQPVVFVSFYPQDADRYEDLKVALSKLRLNDSSLFFKPDSSELLGRGFQVGFLGQLHFEITAERLSKEFHLETTHSFPSVAYQVKCHSRESGNPILRTVNSPKDFPDDYLEAREPMVKVEIITLPQYLGNVLSLKKIFRFGAFNTENIGSRLLLRAKLPLADLISDFDDKLKSVSEGYASLSYELADYEKSNLAKLEILIAGHLIPGLTRVLPKEKIEREARQTVEKLKEILPRQQFSQAVQGQTGGRIIARETIPALKKDVAGYLYGGDRTRKMKLWKKQQKGKTKLKEIASKTEVQIPPSVFKELLKK